jgi:hypothetical protein
MERENHKYDLSPNDCANDENTNLQNATLSIMQGLQMSYLQFSNRESHLFTLQTATLLQAQ